MPDPTFGQRLAATIRAELGQLDDDQELIVANLIDTEFAATQGRLSGFALEPASPVKPKNGKARSELFDALCGACGLQKEGMTAALKRSVAVALAQIMEVTPALEAQEIVRRAREYKRKHPTWFLSPNSLAKYWGTCAARESIRSLLDEPVGWRPMYRTIFPEEQNGATGEVFSRLPWERIDRAHQEKIIRVMGQLQKQPPKPPFSE